MTWANVQLIFMRELRDQLRDRRTLFTVLVLPLLLYPFIGMTFLQVSQFLREHPTRIWIVGYEAAELAVEPPLLIDGELNPNLIDSNDRQLLDVRIDSAIPDSLLSYLPELENSATENTEQPQPTRLLRLLAEQKIDLLVVFPDKTSLIESAAASAHSEESTSQSGGDADLAADTSQVADEATLLASTPRVYLAGNLARDSSRVARQRVGRMLEQWRDAIVGQTLARNSVPATATRPFVLEERDLSQVSTRQAMLWSKILPFVMLLWALTGAFYPAIDSCAGEKERGTLETMLCGPAARSEIVAGKLITIIAFSGLTSLLNLVSMMLSGFLLIRALPAGGAFSIGPPPLLAIVWLVLALIPAAALFGSLALSIAVFARSTKEGQYYLMPLLLVSLPLLMIALMPTTELELGTAIIPLTGLMLLLRELIEGDYSIAFAYAAPVLLVTFSAVYFSTRWAVAQFNNESVIFRESEQVGIGLWFRHLVRDRQDLPGVGKAIFCGILILMLRFFGSLMLPQPSSWNDFASTTAISLLAFIATPALLMALVLTRRPSRTLLLRYPGLTPLLISPLLAIALHPGLNYISKIVMQIYPPSPQLQAMSELLEQLFGQAGGLIPILLVIAATPAICEELAFRGFVLTGLSQRKNKWAAIAISAILFGLAHGILQQTITAGLTGLVLGYLAFQTRSLFPVILYHAVHNGLSVTLDYWSKHQESAPFFTSWMVDFAGQNSLLGYTYHPAAAAVMISSGVALLIWMAWWNPSHSLAPDVSKTTDD